MELCHFHQNIRPIAETPRYQCRIQMPIMPRVLQCNNPIKWRNYKIYNCKWLAWPWGSNCLLCGVYRACIDIKACKGWTFKHLNSDVPSTNCNSIARHLIIHNEVDKYSTPETKEGRERWWGRDCQRWQPHVGCWEFLRGAVYVMKAPRGPFDNLEMLTFLAAEAGITHCFVNLWVPVSTTNLMCFDLSDRGSDHPAMLEAMIKAKQGEYRSYYPDN